MSRLRINRSRAVQKPYDWRPGYQVVLEESRRALDGQRTDFAGLRQRAGALAGFSAVAITLSGLTNHPCVPLLICAGFAFLGVVGYSVAILTPQNLTFDLDAQALYDQLTENPGSVEKFMYGVAGSHADNRAANKVVMDRLTDYYLYGTVALGFEIVYVLASTVVR